MKINYKVTYRQTRSDTFVVTPSSGSIDPDELAWEKAEQMRESGWEVESLEWIGDEDGSDGSS